MFDKGKLIKYVDYTFDAAAGCDRVQITNHYM